MTIIPQFVKDYIRGSLKEKGHVRVDVNVFDKEGGKFLFKHGLNFGPDLLFHGVNGYQLGIEEYLVRTLTFPRKAITITINGKLLSEIVPLELPPPELPPEIDLSNTTEGT